MLISLTEMDLQVESGLLLFVPQLRGLFLTLNVGAVLRCDQKDPSESATEALCDLQLRWRQEEEPMQHLQGPTQPNHLLEGRTSGHL